MEEQRKPIQSQSLLAPSNFDDIGYSAHSPSGRDTDSEDDDFVQGASSSLEIAEYDRTVLHEEEEREKLIGGSAPDRLRRILSGRSEELGKQQQRRKRPRHPVEKTQKWNTMTDTPLVGPDEEGESMYEMEEGGWKSDRSSDSSDELDYLKIHNNPNDKAELPRCAKLSFIFTAIIVLFLVLLLGAYSVSRRGSAATKTKFLSNGTSSFAPTTVLISLDGFRADFLNRGLTPTLNSFVANGISPKYMLPSFPSLTFPNHFTLATGLYPESHGIVGNTFWDPDLEKEFYYTDPSRSMQPEWWGGEPLWVTAENEGIPSAIHMWPGSEAHLGGIEPTYLDKYNGTEILSKKVSRVLEFLDIPGPRDFGASSVDPRPQFIAFYVPVVDQDGHLYGPNSTEIRTTIKNVDNMLQSLFDGLQQRNLTDIINIVVVSDHGMATTSRERLIQLDDLINVKDTIEHIDGWPLYGLRPKNPEDLQGLYNHLAKEATDTSNYDVYLRDVNMPARYHFSRNKRIAPLWIVPRTGYAIVTKDEFDVKQGKGSIYTPRGLHGYDNEHPLMRAIFVARGPAFPHKANSRVGVFQNTEVYNIICDSLQLTPKPNNGTLRLPLKPLGLHSDADAPTENLPDDFATSVEEATPSASGTPLINVDVPQPKPNESVATKNSTAQQENEAKNKLALLWASILGKLQAAEQWAEDLFSDPSEHDVGQTTK